VKIPHNIITISIYCVVYHSQSGKITILTIFQLNVTSLISLTKLNKLIVQYRIIKTINPLFHRLKAYQPEFTPNKNSMILSLASSRNWPYNTPQSTTLCLTMLSTSPTYQPNSTTTPGSKTTNSILYDYQTGRRLPWVLL